MSERAKDGTPVAEDWAFQVIDAQGRKLQIWADGRVEGFGSGCSVINRIPRLVLQAATPAQPAGMREALATALARRLCQLFDSGGESQRSVRARHASAIFQLLNRDAPEYLAEQRWCDASPISYLERGEAMALALPAERPAVAQARES